MNRKRRQRDRVVRTQNLKSGGREFKSHSDQLIFLLPVGLFNHVGVFALFVSTGPEKPYLVSGQLDVNLSFH